MKCHAYPGRLNQASIIVNREGAFLDSVQKYAVFYTALCLLL